MGPRIGVGYHAVELLVGRAGIQGMPAAEMPERHSTRKRQRSISSIRRFARDGRDGLTNVGTRGGFITA